MARNFLLPSEERRCIRSLDPKNPSHFHHLAEVLRRRIEFNRWYEKEKGKLGYAGLVGSLVSEAAEEDGRLRELLSDRNRMIVSNLAGLADIKGKKRLAIAEVFDSVVSELRYWTIEDGAVGRKVWSALEKKKGSHSSLSGKEINRLKLAYRDWVDAPHHFSTRVENAF